MRGPGKIGTEGRAAQRRLLGTIRSLVDVAAALCGGGRSRSRLTMEKHRRRRRERQSFEFACERRRYHRPFSIRA